MRYYFRKNGLVCMSNDKSDIPINTRYISNDSDSIFQIYLSGKYILDYENNTIVPLSISDITIDHSIEETNTIQTQIQALTKQQEFLEDCIAEMAGEVYS